MQRQPFCFGLLPDGGWAGVAGAPRNDKFDRVAVSHKVLYQLAKK